MELTMNTRREIIKKMAPEYQKAKKNHKGLLYKLKRITKHPPPGKNVLCNFRRGYGWFLLFFF